MSDWKENGEFDLRHQATGAVQFGEDFDNIRYNAVQEAIRHYDIFVEPTGRHRVKNLIWWFEPQAGKPLGYLWFMPYDWDASFGPNFNSGWDFVHNALYDHFDIPDSPTWLLPKVTPRRAMSIEHRNAIRELRDLVWYRDVRRAGVRSMTSSTTPTMPSPRSGPWIARAGPRVARPWTTRAVRRRRSRT